MIFRNEEEQLRINDSLKRLIVPKGTTNKGGDPKSDSRSDHTILYKKWKGLLYEFKRTLRTEKEKPKRD